MSSIDEIQVNAAKARLQARGIAPEDFRFRLPICHPTLMQPSCLHSTTSSLSPAIAVDNLWIF